MINNSVSQDLFLSRQYCETEINFTMLRNSSILVAFNVVLLIYIWSLFAIIILIFRLHTF